MEAKESLIYDLIFAKKTKYTIVVGDYTDVYKYDSFVEEITNILLKSKVTIIDSNVNVDSKGVVWKLKIKK